MLAAVGVGRDDRCMPTRTALRRAVVAASLGLLVVVTLAACARPVGSSRSALVGCSLFQHHGNLIAENGRPVFRSIQHDLPPDPVPLDLPDGWEIRATDGGQFEILDATGRVQVTTGTRIIVLSDGDPDSPALNADGALVVCAADPWLRDPQGDDAP
jgi:hypothetical protein